MTGTGIVPPPAKTAMSATIQCDPASHLCELHIHGVLKRAEFSNCESELASRIRGGERPRLLVVLENFSGWERGEGWNNLEFMFTHGDKIARIAVVGAGEKEAEVKAFTGAGLRPSPVRFFPTGEIGDARKWLLE
jgi:hypothetical protein